MGLLASKNQSQRRKADAQAWQRVVDNIALSLCPTDELEWYQARQRELAAPSKGQIKCFPVWRKYRSQALKVAHLQRTLPVLKRLPLQVSHVLSELIYK